MHAVKFATVQAVLENHDRLEATDIEWGISVAERCCFVVEELVSHLSSSRLSAKERRLVNLLKKENRLSTRELLRRLGCSAEELDRIVRPLGRLGLIEMNTETTPAGRKRTFLSTLE